MREQKSGHIIQMSSAAELIAMPLGGAHHASKWALEALNESLAGEVVGFGVKVTMIEPGGFATRSAKNPNPLDNGHKVEPLPSYDGVRQPWPGSRASCPPATRPPRPRPSSSSSTPTIPLSGCSSARASTR
ncbi:SDR family NAD(P)-dependent oxidoreductase [Nonomuraea fuscirosea]|uniref:SDR family NAD(P)-dependent oxidoreductase n=1 Tax=Nonomuraea fuscirosea TaxID=1291556 RepID=UPI001C62D413